MDKLLIQQIDTDLLHQIRRIREEIHEFPELAFNEKRTSKLIFDYLKGLSLDAVERVAGTGIVGHLKGSSIDRTIAFRAEMDALPIQEASELPYASVNSGIMHACGHDGHVAVMLGVAGVLSAIREKLHRNVTFIFQPAEETTGGAKSMLEAGVLVKPKRIEAIFGLHARPQICAGQIELDSVPNAATNPFTISIIGQGCHAAYPHLGIDPIVVGSQIVNSLQQLVSRRLDPFDTVVVSVGSFNSGNSGNIIPSEAELSGTIRTRNPAVQEKVKSMLESICVFTAQAFGAKVDVKIGSGSARVYNNPELISLVREVGYKTLGSENILTAEMPTMGGDDFSFYLEEQGGVPGCLFRLGVASNHPVHTDKFDFGHEATETGILMMVNIALCYHSVAILKITSNNDQKL